MATLVGGNEAELGGGGELGGGEGVGVFGGGGIGGDGAERGEIGTAVGRYVNIDGTIVFAVFANGGDKENGRGVGEVERGSDEVTVCGTGAKLHLIGGIEDLGAGPAGGLGVVVEGGGDVHRGGGGEVGKCFGEDGIGGGGAGATAGGEGVVGGDLQDVAGGGNGRGPGGGERSVGDQGQGKRLLRQRRKRQHGGEKSGAANSFCNHDKAPSARTQDAPVTTKNFLTTYLVSQIRFNG